MQIQLIFKLLKTMSDFKKRTYEKDESTLSFTPKKYIKKNEESPQSNNIFNIPDLHILKDLKKSNSKNNLSFNLIKQLSIQSKSTEKHYSQKKDNQSTLRKCIKTQMSEYKPIFKLTKRLTIIQPMHKQLEQYIDLSLNRHNSNFEVQMISEDIKYGDNVYIQQITSMEKGKSISKVLHTEQMKQLDERLLKDYEIKKQIGHYGMFHENYVCLNKLQKILYYVKKINFPNEEEKQKIIQMSSIQIQLSNRDQDAHLLRFYQSWVQTNSLYMIFELASSSVEEKINNGIRIHQYQIWSLLSDCARTLTYLHQQNVYHLNVKPGNILKCRQKYKLADPFCKISVLTHLLSKNTPQHNILYHPFIAPEIITFFKYTQGLNFIKSDIYSLGMSVIANLLGNDMSLLNQRSQNRKIRSHMNNHLQAYSPKLKRTLLRMISIDPQKRPNTQQIYLIQANQIQHFKRPQKRKLSL